MNCVSEPRFAFAASLLQVVEVGADRAGRGGRRERVAARRSRSAGRRRAPAAPARGLPPAFTQAAYAAWPRMSTWLRISAWPRPQSSVQITGNVPVSGRRDHELVVLAGNRVLLLRELGHPERVDDVLRRDVELDVAVARERQVAGRLAVRVRERPGELLRDHLHLQRVEPALPFWASTIALTIEIAVTSIAGTAVHAISSACCRASAGRRSRRPGARGTSRPSR